ncbi:MAG: hypothetical protein IH948_02675 [Bacteroidetes bacterium]|nr:hypothetical protein [Bacteroidota bacterium]
MDYIKWNDIFVNHFFESSMAGREVLLYVNDEVIDRLGASNGVGVEDFIEVVKLGPEQATKLLLCDKALQVCEGWRERGLKYPPYVGYLVFFVLADVTKTDRATNSYYPGLRKLMGEPIDDGMPRRFDSMITLWDDLEKWSREDKHEELGRFVARIRGNWINVGLPRSQLVLSENEYNNLAIIFNNAGLDPTDSPSPELIPQILSYYGDDVIEQRTKRLLNSSNSDDKVLKRVLTEIVLDELENWDGTFIELDSKEKSPRENYHTSLRLCLKIDSMASSVEIYVRFKSNRLFPEEELHFTRVGDNIEWNCNESHKGWSTPLTNQENEHPKKLDGALLDWQEGERFSDTEVHWRASLKGTNEKLFRIRVDGLPDWVETQKLERGIDFVLACNSVNEDKIRNWGSDACKQFEQIDVTGMPPGWLLFKGNNAQESCQDIDVLTLSSTVRLRLEGGIKTDKRNVYFKFAPPNIVLENCKGSEIVTMNGNPIEQSKNQAHTFLLPENIPSNLPVRIEVNLVDNVLSRVIRLKEFNLPAIFDETPYRNPSGDYDSNAIPIKVYGANVQGAEQNFHYQVPIPSLLNEKAIFIGEIPGEISFWPVNAYPSEWNPVWVAVKMGRKKWDLIFCGTPEQLEKVPKPLASTRDTSLTKQWKNVIWHRRKRYLLPEIKEVVTIWNVYLEVAKNV